MGLCQSRFVQQLFYAVKDSDLEIIAVKIVDDVLITVRRSRIQNFISSIKRRCILGTVVFGPGSFLFYGLQVIQDMDMTIRIHDEEKIE